MDKKLSEDITEINKYKDTVKELQDACQEKQEALCGSEFLRKEAEAELQKLKKLNDELTFILGRPNFVCGRVARDLREAGYEIPKKSESEQAFVIHLMMMSYLEHGADWKKEFKELLNQSKDG